MRYTILAFGAMGAAAAGTGFLLWKLVTQPPFEILPFLFAGFVVWLQDRTIQRLTAHAELTQRHNLALSERPAAAYVAQTEAASRQDQPSTTHDRYREPPLSH